MSAGTAYANKLEQWFQSTPDMVQQVLRPVFDPANNLLEAVAGDPQDLVRAGQRYVDLSRQIIAVADQQRTDRGSLAGAWQGEGYEAFTARAQDIEQKLHQIGEATAGTREVLEAAAQACVDGANLIIDIVVALIAFAVGTLIIQAALAALTAGASAAACAATVIAKGMEALARITQVVTKVAELLRKVAQIFRQLGATLRALAELFKELRLLLKGLDAQLNTARQTHGWFSGAAATSMGVRGAAYGAVNNTLLGGTVPRPLGTVIDSGRDVRDTVESVQDVNEAADN